MKKISMTPNRLYWVFKIVATMAQSSGSIMVPLLRSFWEAKRHRATYPNTMVNNRFWLFRSTGTPE